MGRDQNQNANELIARFGGQSALARALGVNQSTVQHWSKTGHVPSWRREQIERAATQQGIALGWSGAGEAHGGRATPASRVLAELGARRLGAGSAARPVMGYGRASASPGHAPAQTPAPFVHGRADTVIHPDKEMGALREEIGQLRALVEQLVGAVDELREAAGPKRRSERAKEAGAAPGKGRRTSTGRDQRASTAPSSRSKSARS